MTTNTKARKSKMTLDFAMVVLAKHGLDTREGALAAYGDLCATKWGESEREPGLRLMRGSSHGLVANAVAVFDAEAVDQELLAAVGCILTAADRAQLRKGG